MQHTIAPGLDAVASRHWLGHTPRVGDRFDPAAYDTLLNQVLDVLLPHHQAERYPEVGAALVKAIALVACPAVLHGSDDDVFTISETIRQEVYSEIMSARRAILRDTGWEV